MVYGCQNKPPLVLISSQPPGQGLSSVWQDWSNLIKLPGLSEPLYKPQRTASGPPHHLNLHSIHSHNPVKCLIYSVFIKPTYPQLTHYVGDPAPTAHGGISVVKLCWDDGMDWGEDTVVSWFKWSCEAGLSKNGLTCLVVVVREMVREVCSPVQRQERGVVQGSGGDRRQDGLPGPLRTNMEVGKN